MNMRNDFPNPVFKLKKKKKKVYGLKQVAKALYEKLKIYLVLINFKGK